MAGRGLAVLVIGALSLARYSNAENREDKKPILFVSTNQEFNVASKELCSARGLAISANYYLVASRVRRLELEMLAGHIFECGKRPVFVYGKPPAKVDVIPVILGCDVGTTGGVFVGYLEKTASSSLCYYNTRLIIGFPDSELEATEERMRFLVSWVYSKESRK